MKDESRLAVSGLGPSPVWVPGSEGSLGNGSELKGEGRLEKWDTSYAAFSHGSEFAMKKWPLLKLVLDSQREKLF
jgi:hypothetical protein